LGIESNRAAAERVAIEFISQIRAADNSGRRTPIVVVTVHVAELDKRRAVVARADIMLTKPCAPDVLAAALRHVLGPVSTGVRRAY